ncbi:MULTISPECIES: hypothetical protein [Mycobacteriales]|uniref:J domain-containing protein n=1 Tax=Tsukamurella paurometabola TaxID=2061 RepID=A0ABS5NFM8_TSUPA|nr:MULTISPECIES: hypothetical protein [Mycobacteriales]MBS4103071.1 hypothetical protein [Tsukamurella paurometabola]MCZ0911065.1 hypothetical protein [Gordonia amicalis]
MPHIDLYQAYGLDRRQPPDALAAQLTAQLNSIDPRDTLSCNRIDTARVILGDPARRARYDAALGDPAAPVLDEAALATIAGRPVPTAPRTGLAGAFAETKAKVLAAIVGVLALVLVISVTAVACTSSDGGSSPTASDGASQSSAQTSGDSDEVCRAVRGRAVWRAEWEKEKRPEYLLKLTAQTDLPSQVTPKLSSPSVTSSIERMVQYQDKTIGVGEIDVPIGGPPVYVAQYGPDGALIKLHTIRQQSDTTAMPTPFDQAEDISGGYMQVQASDGIDIPSASNGVETNQHYVVNAMPDAFDRPTVWVLLRGGTKLYRGTVYDNAPDSGC